MFGPVAAVDHINIDIEPGEFFTLLAPSGCGKRLPSEWLVV
jgi:iron(III) transport system ATP-binding protein